jgi:hypothetical protein
VAWPWAVHTRLHKNIAELKPCCEEEWSKIPPDRCASLIRNYRKCLVEVASIGGSTSYYIQGFTYFFSTCTGNVYTVFIKDMKTYGLCVIYFCDIDED